MESNNCWKDWRELLVCLGFLLASGLAFYCRVEWLDTCRQLDKQRDLTDAAISSRDLWKHKYDCVVSRKPLTARQRKLIEKYERAQLLEKK